MISLRQQDRVAFANNLYLRRGDSVRVDQLQAESRLRHIDEDIDFFEHRSVFMRRPAGPVARQRSRNTRHQPASLNIASQENIDLSMRARGTSDKVQLLIPSHSLARDKLQRILALNRRQALNQIDLRSGLNSIESPFGT